MFKYFPHALAGIFVPFWIYYTIEPFDRNVWWAENLPIIFTFLALVFTHRIFRFSNWSYGFMACWLFWHTIGGHYTFELAFADFFKELLNTDRNHFDRVGHFIIGFYAFPIAELMSRKKYIAHKPTLYLFALFSIMSLAAFYELVEWQYAVKEGGEAGLAFLGSQGDIWDAQKDILCDTLGAIFSLFILRIVQKQVLPEKKAMKGIMAKVMRFFGGK